VETVARKAAAYIMAEEWYKGLPKKEYVSKQKEVAIHGDLAEMKGASTKEELSLVFVSNRDKESNVTEDPASPVLLLGDSHTLVFSVGGDMHTKGAGLFDHLALELGLPVDRIGVRGSGATPSRIKLYQRSRKKPDFLKNKKTVIWCLSARELTGPGGWRKIPIAKKE
jgi:alginate O-acetyltransferase complex protein AlgJ